MVVIHPPKGRGRARIIVKASTDRAKPGKRGNHGPATSKQSSRASTPASVVVLPTTSFHDNIPASAKLPCEKDAQEDTLWVNNQGEEKARQVIGDRVYIRQQPAAVPQHTPILLITDQIMRNFAAPDRYIQCVNRMGYTLDDYTNDIRDSSMDLQFPYILVFLGTLRLGKFQQKVVRKSVGEFVKAINEVNNNSVILFSSLVPQPMDHDRSEQVCAQYSKVLQGRNARTEQEKQVELCICVGLQ